MNEYSFTELKTKALSPTASEEDTMNLLEWFNTYGQQYWNGEAYDIDGRWMLRPIFAEADTDEFELIGAEII